MGYSVNDSKVKDLLANPKATEILDKYIPGMSTDKRLGPAMGMTLKAMKPFSQGKITDEILNSIDEELKKL